MNRRVVVLFFCVLLLFFTLDARIFVISAGGEQAVQTAGSHGRYTIRLNTGRGTIYDRNRIPIVNQGVKYVAVVAPGANASAQMSALAPHVSDTAVLTSGFQKGFPFTVTVDTPDLSVAGVKIITTKVRYLPNAVAPHITGYVDSGGNGVTGIEKAFDSVLKQYSGTVTESYAVNAKNRALSGIEPASGVTGNPSGGVVLTLDAGVQAAAQKAADQYLTSGSVIVMDVANGDILASVSEPAYSPSNVAASLKQSGSPLLNRVFSSYNLGSVFKIAVSCAALESGISEHFKYDCEGEVDVYGREFHCHKLTGHGEEDMGLAFANSCNPYFITVGLKTGGAKILEMAKRFGFGTSATFAPGLSSDAGALPTDKALQVPAAVANISMGQGDLMVTPVQVACMVSAIANGGCLPTARLVEGVFDGERMVADYPGAVPDRVVSQEIADKVKAFMIETVDVGTGLPAKPLAGGAGGKTATAETGWLKDGQTINQAWFAGFYPAKNPKYAIVAMCENGKAGGADAGPVFKSIADSLAPMCGFDTGTQPRSSADSGASNAARPSSSAPQGSAQNPQ